MSAHRLGRRLAACLVVVVLAVPARAVPSPARIVEDFHAVLLNVMKEADMLGFEGRYEWLRPVIAETFNLTYMTRVSTGHYWANASAAEKQKLIDAFARMTTATYAARFDGYSGEHFEIVSQGEGPRESVIVRTRLVESDGSTVALNYVLRRFDGDWRVIDIYLKGAFSELANRRSEYTSIIRREGYEGLLSAIDRKVRELAEDARAG